jgi:hypothetical protein
VDRIGTYSEFWPFYLAEHKNAVNRRLHFVGTTLGLCWLIAMFFTGHLWFVLFALVTGYAFAWIGHFFFEKNKPATFRYPLWSFISDWRLWYCMLSKEHLWRDQAKTITRV